MKQKIGTLIEEEIMRLAKRKAAEEKRPQAATAKQRKTALVYFANVR
jgi:hypothetical protein